MGEELEEKINLNEIKKLNEWDIIETYFRDNPNYKSQHQIDSFNEFIYSKTNGIEYIIKRENPQIIYKEATGDDNYRYQINLFYGETLNDDGTINDKIIDNIFVSSPIEYSEKKSTYMYPNIARLKGFTYGSSIYCNIGVIFKDNETDEITIKNFPKINIGLMPIMVKSKLCILNDLDDIRLKELGECPYDQGGYFIINGKEKVILSQEKKINNILYINFNSESNIKIPIQAVLKSISKEGFQSSRTNVIALNRVIAKIKPSDLPIQKSNKTEIHSIVEINDNAKILSKRLKIPFYRSTKEL